MNNIVAKTSGSLLNPPSSGSSSLLDQDQTIGERRVNSVYFKVKNGNDSSNDEKTDKTITLQHDTQTEKELFKNLIEKTTPENFRTLKKSYTPNLAPNSKILKINQMKGESDNILSNTLIDAWDELVFLNNEDELQDYKNCEGLIDNYLTTGNSKIISLIKKLLNESNKGGVKGYGRLGILESSLINCFERNQFYDKENKKINLTKIHNLEQFKRLYTLFNYITWLLNSKDNILYAAYSNELVENIKANITFPDRVLNGYKEDDLVIAMKNSIKNLTPKIRYSLNLELEMLFIGQTFSFSQNYYGFSNFGKLGFSVIPYFFQSLITYFCNKAFSVNPYDKGKVNGKFSDRIKDDKKQLVNILKRFEVKDFDEGLKALPNLLDSLTKDYKNDWFNNIIVEHKVNGQQVRFTLTMLFFELLRKLPATNVNTTDIEKIKEKLPATNVNTTDIEKIKEKLPETNVNTTDIEKIKEECKKKLTKLIDLAYFSDDSKVIGNNEKRLISILTSFETKKNLSGVLEELPQLLDNLTKDYKHDWFNNITVEHKVNGQQVRFTLTMLFSELLRKLSETNVNTTDIEKIKECKEKLIKLIDSANIAANHQLKDILFKINQQLYFPNVDRVKIIFLIDKFRVMLDKYCQNNKDNTSSEYKTQIDDLKNIYSHIVTKLLTEKIKSRTAYSGDLLNILLISLTSIIDISSSNVASNMGNSAVSVVVGLINAFITGIQGDSTDYMEEFGKAKLRTIKNITNNTIKYISPFDLSYGNSIPISKKRILIKKDPNMINIFADLDIVDEILGMNTYSAPKMLESKFYESLGLTVNEKEIFTKNINLILKYHYYFYRKQQLLEEQASNKLKKDNLELNKVLDELDLNLSKLSSDRFELINLVEKIYEKIDSKSYTLKQYSRIDHFHFLSNLLQKIKYEEKYEDSKIYFEKLDEEISLEDQGIILKNTEVCFDGFFGTMSKEEFYKLYLKLNKDEIKNLTSTVSSKANVDELTIYRNNKIRIFNKIYNNLFAPGTNGTVYFEVLLNIIENESDDLLKTYFKSLIKEEIQVSKNDKNSRMYGLNKADEKKYLISVVGTIVITFIITIIKIFALSVLSPFMLYIIFSLLIFTVILMRDVAIYQLDISNYNKKFQPILNRLDVDLTGKQDEINQIIEEYFKSESKLQDINLLDSDTIVERIINFLGENVSTKPSIIKKLNIILNVCEKKLDSNPVKYKELLMKLKDKLTDTSSNLGIHEIINRNDHIRTYILLKAIFEAVVNSLVLCLTIFKNIIYDMMVLVFSITFLKALVIWFRNKYYQAFKIRSKTNKMIGKLLNDKIMQINKGIATVEVSVVSTLDEKPIKNDTLSKYDILSGLFGYEVGI